MFFEKKSNNRVLAAVIFLLAALFSTTLVSAIDPSIDSSSLSRLEEAKSLPSYRHTAHGIAVGDINNDGLMDLVFAENEEHVNDNPEINQIRGWPERIYINKGNGQFADESMRRLGTISGYQTVSVALGDVNGDNRLDLVLANYKQRVAFLFQQPDGTFRDVTQEPTIIQHETRLPQTYEFPIGKEVLIEDLDQDGDNDVIVAYRGYVGIYEHKLENGRHRLVDVSTQWSHPNNRNAGQGIESIWTADDGSNEVLRYLRFNNDGGKILLEDLDKDGFKDLIIPVHTEGFVNQGSLNRIFMNRPVQARSNTRSFLYDLCFQFPQNLHHTTQLLAYDWDNDRDTDFVASLKGEHNLVYRNIISSRGVCNPQQPTPAFEEDSATYRASGLPLDDQTPVVFASADVNADNNKDLAAYQTRCELEFSNPSTPRIPTNDCSIVLYLKSQNRFTSQPVSTIYQGKHGKMHTKDVVFANLNNDNFPDIVYGTGESRALLHNGNAREPAFPRSDKDPFPYSSDNLISSGQLVDLNNDNIPDILSSNQGYSECGIGDTDPDMVGEGSSSCHVLLTPFKYFRSNAAQQEVWEDAVHLLDLPLDYTTQLSYPGVPCTGDLDDDGDLDLVLPYRNSENLLLLNRGDGSFVNTPSKIPQDQFKGNFETVLDHSEPPKKINMLNGVEIANGNVVRINPLISNFLKDANGVNKETWNLQFLRGNVNSRVPFGAQGCIIQDFNGDGRQDVFMNYGPRKQERFFLNQIGANGANSWSLSEIPFRGTNVADRSSITLDFDKDNDPDIISLTRDGRVRLLRNNGQAQFSDEIITDLFPGVDLTLSSKLIVENVMGDAENEIIFVRYIPRTILPGDPIPSHIENDVWIYTRTLQNRGAFTLVPPANIISDPDTELTETERHHLFTLAARHTQDITFLDINGDGLQDLFKGKQVFKERVYLQQRPLAGQQFPRWIEVTDTVMDARNFKTYYVDSADMNQDNLEDVIVFQTSEPHLYLQTPSQHQDSPSPVPVFTVLKEGKVKDVILKDDINRFSLENDLSIQERQSRRLSFLTSQSCIDFTNVVEISRLISNLPDPSGDLEIASRTAILQHFAVVCS
ncbi:VCBS repeat-containing protein [Candidatus Woesearchaeota archaeon]|nr:VCBS repeat-containing protein [Candidatus Woesearchaeota archaeon]